MEIQIVDGFDVRMPEKSQQRKFLDKVKNVGGVLVNYLRRDSGTSGHKHGHIDNDSDTWLDAKNKKIKEDQAAQQEISEGFEGKATSVLEDDFSVEDQISQMDERDGVDEYEYLKRQQGSRDGVTIDDETEFSDGSRSDGSYPNGVYEPTDEEIIEAEAAEKKEQEFERAERGFYGDRGNMGKRGRGKWFR